MKFIFNAASGPVLIKGQISGPAGTTISTFVLDTGATTTTINTSVLRLVGYDPSLSTDFVQMTASSGVTTVPRIMLNRMSALGQHQVGIRVVAFDLPQAASVDGLLGLDSLRSSILTIDFRAGEISLA